MSTPRRLPPRSRGTPMIATLPIRPDYTLIGDGRHPPGDLEDDRRQGRRIDLPLARLEAGRPGAVHGLRLEQLRLERAPPLGPRIAAAGPEQRRSEVGEP